MVRAEPMRRRPATRFIAVASVLGLGIVVMLAASLQGAPEIGEPRFSAPDWLAIRPTPLPVPPEPDQPPQVLVDRPADHVVTQIVMATLLALIAAALIALAVRLLISAWRGRRLRLRRGSVTGAEGALDDDPIAQAQRMRRGLSDALGAIADRRDPSEAIVAAWVELEESASAAGTVRGRSETPAEFTVRVIARTDDVEAEALALLMLYERVRFGGLPADEDDREAARAALGAVEAAWR